MSNLDKFRALGISEATLATLSKKGFEEPTEIQEKTIPILLEGHKNVIGQARTGTGKTAAFGIPLIEMLEPGQRDVQAIVLTPTRELALQVAEEIHSLCSDKKMAITTVYGGQSITEQLRKLKRGTDIVVGTPGRVIDHINRKSLRLDNIKYFILDEADEMLNMGFLEDVEQIMFHTPADKQVLLFSATMPDHILQLARKHMPDYELIKVTNQELTTNLTDQIYFEVRTEDKFEALCRIIDVEPDFYGLMFCRTKRDVDELSQRLIDRGYDAEAIHGDLSQHQRERIMDKFKKQHINLLVATDVAARGIDVNNLTHVINYALPQDPESYVHRIGRTGRAGNEGTAITFITPSEYRKLMFIEKVAKTKIRKEKLPDIQDVIGFKKDRIIADIEDMVEEGPNDQFHEMAQQFLDKYKAEDVLAGILKFFFEEELDTKSYREIREVKAIDKQGTTRLFVARGKKHGMGPKSLLEFIEKEAKVDKNVIKDFSILDDFSFINVPFTEAETILRAFQGSRGQRPLVTKAKERSGGGGGRGGRR